jgi:hypothetical protein
MLVKIIFRNIKRVLKTAKYLFKMWTQPTPQKSQIAAFFTRYTVVRNRTTDLTLALPTSTSHVPYATTPPMTCFVSSLYFFVHILQPIECKLFV